MLRAVAAEVGIADFRPHMTRHTWVHSAKKAGRTDEYMRRTGGWESDAMLRRIYGAAAVDERVEAEAGRALDEGWLR